MLHLSPRAMIVTGVLMMAVGGVIVPFLMVMHTIEATFFLVFTSYAVSVSGLYLGIIGVAQYVQTNKKDR
jgi:hypothetical protein